MLDDVYFALDGKVCICLLGPFSLCMLKQRSLSIVSIYDVVTRGALATVGKHTYKIRRQWKGHPSLSWNEVSLYSTSRKFLGKKALKVNNAIQTVKTLNFGSVRWLSR